MTEDEELSFFLTPSRVSLVPLPTPSCTRRSSLSSRLEAPLPPARKKLAWISLQGRLVGAEDATSARTIGGGLSLEEAAAWELFSPLQRVLMVAVVAAAENESRKGRVIDNLQRSVKIRDEVLQDMQKKFDDLCEQMYSSEDQPTIHTHKGSSESDEFREYMMSETKVANFCSTVCSLPQLNPDCGVPPLSGNLSNWAKDPGAELCKVEAFNTSHPNMGEPEERRMSDLSDFSSVSSSVDIHQLRSTLAEEQNIYNLRKECQQKDAIIDKLTAEAHESSIAHSKRISGLEEIIRRKNMIITKLKKAKPASEVIQPMREQRPSTALNTENKTTLAMTTNILYDMSSSSSSSSDSDTPVHQKDRQLPQASVKSDSQPSAKSLGYSNLPPNKRPKHRPASPVKASYIVSRADSTGMLRPKRLVSASADSKRTSRQSQQESSCVASQKRWV